MSSAVSEIGDSIATASLCTQKVSIHLQANGFIFFPVTALL